jgi:EmrB/QacA subfamily drug resistance transporter
MRSHHKATGTATQVGTSLDRHLVALGAVVVLGTLMSILDSTIVNVAIATLARDFQTSLATIQWVATGYLLALATVIPLTGWASDRFGTKRVYMLAIALFMAGSALSGLAWSAGSLIAFRVFQGLGGGMILPAGITILTRAAGSNRVGRVMSLLGVPAMLGPILGPALGGWIVEDFSWRWIFYINVPIGVLALVLARTILPPDRPTPADRLDILGLALLSPGVAALVYGLAATESGSGLGSARALLGLSAGAMLVASYVVHALRARRPLLDLRLLRSRAVAASAATSFLLSASFFGMLLLLPLYFQVVRGESPLMAGLLLAPRGLGAGIMLVIAGRIVDRSGPGKLVLAGLAITALSTLPWTQVSATTSHWLLLGAQLVQGFGLGMAMQPAMAGAYQTVDRAELSQATAVLNSIRRIGGSIGVALLAVALEHQIKAEIPAVGGAGLGSLENVLGGSGPLAPDLAHAFAHAAWWGLALTALAVVPALFLPRTRPRAQAADADAVGRVTSGEKGLARPAGRLFPQPGRWLRRGQRAA